MFHRGRVGNVLSIPLYVLTCKVIDNKATLTLTFDFEYLDISHLTTKNTYDTLKM